ncbi:hypothetical protein CAQUA_00510 [Corynebacterium aquatimens]|nr:hypothetical protein CAQUA_00510 [Corynebacterium aquatimens]
MRASYTTYVVRFLAAIALCAAVPALGACAAETAAPGIEPMFADVEPESSDTSPDISAEQQRAFFVRASDGTEPSSPQCDGRGVLILASVQLWADEVPDRLARELAADPRAEFTYPGQCRSLRDRDNGDPIYPVYIDFGNDIDALCDAAASHPGGTTRLLRNVYDDVMPC